MAVGDLDKIMDSLKKGLEMAEHTDFKGHCEKCGEAVLNDTGPGITYSQDGVQHAYHRKCFTCNECRKPIDDGSFFLHQEHPYCKTCYEDKVLGRCDKCGESLANAAIMKAGEKKFHPRCFTCAKCNTELQNRYFDKDQTLYCRTCYEDAFIPSCNACMEKIMPDADSGKITMVEWKEKKFHQGCFACKDCKNPFTDLKALHHKGELYCQDCYFKVIRSMDEAEKVSA